MHEEMNQQFNQIMSMIQHNPTLANVKPEVLAITTTKKYRLQYSSVSSTIEDLGIYQFWSYFGPQRNQIFFISSST